MNHMTFPVQEIQALKQHQGNWELLGADLWKEAQRFLHQAETTAIDA